MNSPRFKTVGIVGTGAMGRGIAQIAAQAGSAVLLYDTQAEAVAKARQAVAAQWDKLVAKGRLTPEQAQAQQQRLQPAGSLADLAGCELVIEAVPEKLALKQELFQKLSAICAPTTILASNTSSLSLTEIARRSSAATASGYDARLVRILPATASSITPARMMPP